MHPFLVITSAIPKISLETGTELMTARYSLSVIVISLLLCVMPITITSLWSSLYAKACVIPRPHSIIIRTWGRRIILHAMSIVLDFYILTCFASFSRLRGLNWKRYFLREHICFYIAGNFFLPHQYWHLKASSPF